MLSTTRFIESMNTFIGEEYSKRVQEEYEITDSTGRWGEPVLLIRGRGCPALMVMFDDYMWDADYGMRLSYRDTVVGCIYCL